MCLSVSPVVCRGKKAYAHVQGTEEGAISGSSGNSQRRRRLCLKMSDGSVLRATNARRAEAARAKHMDHSTKSALCTATFGSCAWYGFSVKCTCYTHIHLCLICQNASRPCLWPPRTNKEQLELCSGDNSRLGQLFKTTSKIYL